MSLTWDDFKTFAKEFLSYSIKVGDTWEWIETSNEYGNGYLVNNSHIVQSKIFHVHIVYSISYSCPVLYFNVYEIDGELLSISKVWELLKLSVNSSEELWKVVSQGQHPHLNIPFNMIHPCETTSFIGKLIENTEESLYLLTWISLYGSVIHLHCKEIRHLYFENNNIKEI